ncbi:MAG: DNA/RNA nuclease SfsA [Leptolyngbyaceae cyanobacterium SL_7_1]|nr:DNA/RNA nuclease SfsA [Leptolyngbyaceae cyanobacterium SL_7_1]
MTPNSADWFFPYPPLYPGVLLKRYKRFFADIELASGEVITAHCPNTGPMTGVYLPGNRVMVSRSDNPKRSLPYTWEMIEVHDTKPTWVGVNTALPNRVIQAALAAQVLPGLAHYSQIRTEVPYGQDNKSRIDFLLNSDEGDRPVYLEVKNTTWTQGHCACFPDTVTTRGQKHLRELTDLLPHHRAIMLYFINRGDCTEFAPGDSADPTYGQLLRSAIAAGVEILPCRFAVSPTEVRYVG